MRAQGREPTAINHTEILQYRIMCRRANISCKQLEKNCYLSNLQFTLNIKVNSAQYLKHFVTA